MTTQPCDWPIDTGCFDDTWEALDPDVQDRAVALASATLRRLTGYRVGGCPVTVRPCKRSCWGDYLPRAYYDMLTMGYGLSGFWPHIGEEGLWVNSCGCATDCSCGALCEIALPPPVGAVYSVKIDGATLPASDYRVDGASLVYLGSGDCPFPSCQDLALADTEPGTFSVTYLNAHPVDKLGEYAAGVLANEFAKACSGAKCRLPATVGRVTRQGVSMEIPAGAFPNGVTGIREVDAYVGLWRPDGAPSQPPRVWFPNQKVPRVVPT